KDLWAHLPPVIPQDALSDSAIDDDDRSDSEHGKRQPRGNDKDKTLPLAAHGGLGAPANLEARQSASTDVIRDYLMAYRMRKLPPAPKQPPRYVGASDINLWTRRAVERFEQSVAEAAHDGIDMRRLFLIGIQGLPKLNLQSPDELFLTLRKHAIIS